MHYVDECLLCIVQCTVYSLQWAVCSVQCEVWSVKCAVCSAHLEVYSVQCVVFNVKCAVYSTEQCVVYRVKLCVCPPAQREPPCSLAQTRIELKVWLPLFMAPVHYGTLWNWPQLLEDVHTESLLRRRPGCCGFLCALSPHLKRSLVSGTRVFQTEC